MFPPWPTPLWTLVVTWLSKRVSVEPVLVIEILPPSARSDVVVIALPPCMDSVFPKTRLMLPASAWALPVLFAEIVDPPCSVTSPAAMLISPPAPVPLVLERRLAPPARESEPASMAIVPARPAPDADAEICPWLARLTLPPDTAIWPASPVLVAVLKSPAPPLRDREVDALTAIVPPCPAPEVLLSIRPVSARFTVRAATEICPAAPTPSVMLKIPLRRSWLKGLTGAPGDCPEANTSFAVILMLPPAPVAENALLATICPPPVRLRVPTSATMLPALPSWIVLVCMRPLSMVRFGVEIVTLPTLLVNA